MSAVLVQFSHDRNDLWLSYWIDSANGGRILNRLSSYLYMIDDFLPFILNILLANFVGLLGIGIVLSNDLLTGFCLTHTIHTWWSQLKIDRRIDGKSNHVWKIMMQILKYHFIFNVFKEFLYKPHLCY